MCKRGMVNLNHVVQCEASETEWVHLCQKMRKTGVHFIVVGVRAVWLLAVRSVDNCQTCESGTLGDRLSKGMYGPFEDVRPVSCHGDGY
jgi:hypothetical protein